MNRQSTSSADRVTCIVPAYNEGARIGAVLDVLSAHPLIDHIIVVDDGSGDDTLAIARTYNGIEIIALGSNGGKTRALAHGLARATSAYILLIDSDLEGLSAAALTDLINPFLQGHAGMAISLRRNAPRLWHWIGIDYISGERIFRRDLVADRLDELDRLPRFGFEVWLNSILVNHGVRLAIISWAEVASPLKSSKQGFWRGLNSDLWMLIDLFRTVGPYRLVSQIVQMRHLRVDPKADCRP